MPRSRKERYGVFVHDPDGDMGQGVIVGAFIDAGRADDEADRIRRAAHRADCDHIEPVVVELVSGGISADEVIRRVSR